MVMQGEFTSSNSSLSVAGDTFRSFSWERCVEGTEYLKEGQYVISNIREDISAFASDLLAVRTDLRSMQLSAIKTEQELERWIQTTQGVQHTQEALSEALLEDRRERQVSRHSAKVSHDAGSATPSKLELLEDIGKLRAALESEVQLRLVAESKTAEELKLFASQLQQLAPANAALESLVRSELKLLSDRVDEEARLRSLGDQKQEKANEVSFNILNTEFENEASRRKNSINILGEAINSLRTELEQEVSERTRGDKLAPELLSSYREQVAHCHEELLEVKEMRSEDTDNFRNAVRDLNTQVAQHVEELQLLIGREKSEAGMRVHHVAGGLVPEFERQTAHIASQQACIQKQLCTMNDALLTETQNRIATIKDQEDESRRRLAKEDESERRFTELLIALDQERSDREAAIQLARSQIMSCRQEVALERDERANENVIVQRNIQTLGAEMQHKIEEAHVFAENEICHRVTADERITKQLDELRVALQSEAMTREGSTRDSDRLFRQMQQALDQALDHEVKTRTEEVASLKCMVSSTDNERIELKKLNASLENKIVEVGEKMAVLRQTVAEDVACGRQEQVTEMRKWMHQHDSRSMAELESVRTESRSQEDKIMRELTSDRDLQDKERAKRQDLENKVAELQLLEDQFMHKVGLQVKECKDLFDNNPDREVKLRNPGRSVERVEKSVGERLNKIADECEGRFQTLKQSLQQETRRATLSMEQLQQQFDAKVEKDTQVVGALSEQCGTLSCLMSKERMEFSAWRKDTTARQENCEKTLSTLSAEMRDTYAGLSDRMKEYSQHISEPDHSTVHDLEQPSAGIPLRSAQLEESRVKQETELDVIRRAIKNQRLREVEVRQSSSSVSLDSSETSGNHHFFLKPSEERGRIAHHMCPVDHLALIDNANLGSSNLDLSTAVGSASPSCDCSRSTSRSTCSQSVRGGIKSASASVRSTAPSFGGKASEAGSVKVHTNQQFRNSASMNLPICSAGHWRDGAGSALLPVDGSREPTHGVNGAALGTNDKGGRGLLSTSPTQTLSRLGHNVPSSSFSPPHGGFPSKHNKFSPASPEYRAVRRSSRLKGW